MTYDTSGKSREVEGVELVDRGLRVAVQGGLTSGLILFEAI
ncbi:MAG: hypothetical protein ACP5JJ_10655 [Anaerolineae bacterium]